MKALRFYVWPSLLAATVLAVPFAAAVVFASIMSISPARTLIEWLGVFAYAALVDVLVAVLPFIFYVLARFTWREKERVVREHLFGWPIALGIICSAVLIVVTALVGLPLFWAFAYLVLGAAVVASGLVASRVWLRLSYR